MTEDPTPWLTVEESGSQVNDATMAEIRKEYEVLNRIICNPAYDGKAIKAEAWAMFKELRYHRQRDTRLTEETHEYEQLTGRMSMLLTATANALKGEPAELHLHDWSDLPAVAKRLAFGQPDSSPA